MDVIVPALITRAVREHWAACICFSGREEGGTVKCAYPALLQATTAESRILIVDVIEEGKPQGKSGDPGGIKC